MGEHKFAQAQWTARIAPRPSAALDDLQRAAAESADALAVPLQMRLAAGLGRDFSNVRVHGGPHSARAAMRLGARAYTLGNDIHLGAEVQGMPASERDHLLVHEAVHTVQQGERRVAPHAALDVSRPGDTAEVEAQGIAQALRTGGPSLALRRSPHRAPLAIARSVAPQLQRDLTQKFPMREGDFKLDLKTESHPGAKSGMSGTIKFKANQKAPDSTSIRLLQVVRLEDLSTGKDYVWTGGDADRNKVMTTASKDKTVEGGFLVDHDPAKASPRTKAGDAPVPPYYRHYWPNATASQDGSKQGKAVREASLWDYPGWSQKCRFSFETVARAAAGHVYGTVMWGFTISDGAKGIVDKERAVGRNVTLRTTDKAIDKFNEFYRNPGASTAP